MITDASYAASGQTLKVVIAHIKLSLIPMQAGPRIDTRIARATEGRIDAVIVRFAEDFAGPLGCHRCLVRRLE